MLAPLGFYLLIILIASTLILQIRWAHDTDRAEIEAGWPRLANFEFPVHRHTRTFHVQLPAQRLSDRGRGPRRRDGCHRGRDPAG
jgi:hypothetical protein